VREEESLTSGLVTRRNAIALGGIGMLGFLAIRRSALAQVSLSKDTGTRDLLVVVFLRGGADGLSLVPPYGEDAYHKGRPNLRLAGPRESGGAKALDLDGFFGLHPSLAPLLPEYREGRMAVVHAAGSGDQTRSHFEAMSAMERGLPDAVAGPASGWLARYLTESQSPQDSPLRAVALGTIMPDSLRGGTAGSVIRSVSDFRIAGRSGDRFADLLKLAYSGGKDEAYQAGRDTLEILDALKKLDPKTARAGASYPDSDLGEGLRQVAMLDSAGVGLEVACLDKGGWDTHVAQGITTGWLPGLLDDLGSSLAAFVKDMGPRMSRTTVVVMTEFGRRAYENTGLGTDHGRASAMLLLGGGIRGGKVYTDWPGLSKDQLEPPGDLRVTTDYRSVLAEVLERRMAFGRPGEIFEGLGSSRVGLVS
jgi:uncharacterized protein (DUF1501 family)